MIARDLAHVYLGHTAPEYQKNEDSLAALEQLLDAWGLADPDWRSYMKSLSELGG